MPGTVTSMFTLFLLAGWVLGAVGFLQARRALREVAKLREDLARGPAVSAASDAVAAASGPATLTPALALARSRPEQPWAGLVEPSHSAEPPVPLGPVAPSQRPQPVREPAAPSQPPQQPALAPGARFPPPDQPAPGPTTASPEADLRPPRPRAVPARADIEALLTMRWGVWLGAVALVMAGVFLVRYAAEQGMIGPGPRCALAGLLGVALIAGAEWLRRREILRPGVADQAAPALAAGGVSVLFGAAYGASVVYALVPPAGGFGLLATASLAGLALSLRHGQVVAAVGIVGAFVTPALVQTADPSLPGLFGYLLFVTAAALAVVRYTAWIWLGWVCTAAGVVWVLLALIGDGLGASAWAPALFVTAAAALNLALLPGEALAHPVGRRLAWVPVAALGITGLLLATLDQEWATRAGVLLLTPVTIAKAAREPRLRLLPFIAATLFLLLLAGWSIEVRELPDFTPPPGRWTPSVVRALTDTAAFMAGCFAASGLWFERRTIRPLAWSGLVASVPVLALAVCYAWVAAFNTRLDWAALALLLAAGLMATTTAALRGAGSWTATQGGGRMPADAEAAGVAAIGAAAIGEAAIGAASLGTTGAEHTGADAAGAPAAREQAAVGEAARAHAASTQAAGPHAAGAVAALALGCAMMLREHGLTVALSLFLPMLAWVAAKVDLPPLRKVALAVASVVLVRLLLNWYVLGYAFGGLPVASGLLLAYGLPAATFAVAAAMFFREGDDLTVGVLEAGSVAFVTALVAMEIRHAGAPLAVATTALGFIEAAQHVSALAVLAVATLRIATRLNRPVLHAGWRTLGALAIGGGVLLILFNPILTDAPVGHTPLLDWLLPAYLLPAGLALFAAREPATAQPPWLRRSMAGYAVVAGFAWTTLEVRHVFHPAAMGMLTAPVTDAELWAWSGAWLAYGAALMAAGIRIGAKPMRLAALAIIGLTAAKVFLVDMSGLVGLWRVVSFLGLGLTLISLGAVYRRFVATGEAAG